jgi:hypothetical protein
LLKRFSQSFLNRADEAAFWEAYVGAVLARAGLYVVHNPMKLGEFHDPACSTQSDLGVYQAHPDSVEFELEAGTQIEVKSRNIRFTSPEDYKCDDVRVCSESWFRKNWGSYEKFARDFFLVSQQTGAIVWVPAGTHAVFGKEIRDNERNESFKIVQCHKSDLRTVEEFVKSLEHGKEEA